MLSRAVHCYLVIVAIAPIPIKSFPLYHFSCLAWTEPIKLATAKKRNADAATRALQAYLGHRNIQHTVWYTELSPTRFKDFLRA